MQSAPPAASSKQSVTYPFSRSFVRDVKDDPKSEIAANRYKIIHDKIHNTSAEALLTPIVSLPESKQVNDLIKGFKTKAYKAYLEFAGSTLRFPYPTDSPLNDAQHTELFKKAENEFYNKEISLSQYRSTVISRNIKEKYNELLPSDFMHIIEAINNPNRQLLVEFATYDHKTKIPIDAQPHKHIINHVKDKLKYTDILSQLGSKLDWTYINEEVFDNDGKDIHIDVTQLLLDLSTHNTLKASSDVPKFLSGKFMDWDNSFMVTDNTNSKWSVVTSNKQMYNFKMTTNCVQFAQTEGWQNALVIEKINDDIQHMAPRDIVNLTVIAANKLELSWTMHMSVEGFRNVTFIAYISNETGLFNMENAVKTKSTETKGFKHVVTRKQLDITVLPDRKDEDLFFLIHSTGAVANIEKLGVTPDEHKSHSIASARAYVYHYNFWTVIAHTMPDYHLDTATNQTAHLTCYTIIQWNDQYITKADRKHAVGSNITSTRARTGTELKYLQDEVLKLRFEMQQLQNPGYYSHASVQTGTYGPYFIPLILNARQIQNIQQSNTGGGRRRKKPAPTQENTVDIGYIFISNMPSLEVKAKLESNRKRIITNIFKKYFKDVFPTAFVSTDGLALKHTENINKLMSDYLRNTNIPQGIYPGLIGTFLQVTANNDAIKEWSLEWMKTINFMQHMEQGFHPVWRNRNDAGNDQELLSHIHNTETDMAQRRILRKNGNYQGQMQHTFPITFNHFASKFQTPTRPPALLGAQALTKRGQRAASKPDITPAHDESLESMQREIASLRRTVNELTIVPVD